MGDGGELKANQMYSRRTQDVPHETLLDVFELPITN